MIHPDQLGARIAARRRALCMTQYQLADSMGVTPQAVSKWERGLTCPDLTILDELASCLAIGLEELLLGHDRVPLSA